MTTYSSCFRDDLMFIVYNSLVVLRNNLFRTLNLVTKRGHSRSVWNPEFSSGGGGNPHRGCANLFFAENCMKMKEFGSRIPQC